MEQHPIPQDVTGFQFKLIGTMTVKQFGYVAGGAILAVLSWYAPAPGFFWQLLAKGILLPFFGLIGVIVAFVPIEGRPIDVMAANFFHALITPNQYIYIKRGRKFSFNLITISKSLAANPTGQNTSSHSIKSIESKKEKQLRAILSAGYKEAKNNLDKKELNFIRQVSTTPTLTPALLSTQPRTSVPASTAPPPASLPAQGTAPIHTITSQAPQAAQPVPQAVHKNANLTDNPALDSKHVRNIPQNMTREIGLPHVPDAPNIISGIVKDPRGNVLPNILVDVKDSLGNPVRAFKTNPLGQFTSATQLTNGVYTIELEDPKKLHVFNIIQISARGEIMPPVEIISHDAREALKLALFAN